jgi:hypothetical protein
MSSSDKKNTSRKNNKEHFGLPPEPPPPPSPKALQGLAEIMMQHEIERPKTPTHGSFQDPEEKQDAANVVDSQEAERAKEMEVEEANRKQRYDDLFHRAQMFRKDRLAKRLQQFHADRAPSKSPRMRPIINDDPTLHMDGALKARESKVLTPRSMRRHADALLEKYGVKGKTSHEKRHLKSHRANKLQSCAVRNQSGVKRNVRKQSKQEVTRKSKEPKITSESVSVVHLNAANAASLSQLGKRQGPENALSVRRASRDALLSECEVMESPRTAISRVLDLMSVQGKHTEHVDALVAHSEMKDRKIIELHKKISQAESKQRAAELRSEFEGKIAAVKLEAARQKQALLERLVVAKAEICDVREAQTHSQREERSITQKGEDQSNLSKLRKHLGKLRPGVTSRPLYLGVSTGEVAAIQTSPLTARLVPGHTNAIASTLRRPFVNLSQAYQVNHHAKEEVLCDISGIPHYDTSDITLRRESHWNSLSARKVLNWKSKIQQLKEKETHSEKLAIKTVVAARMKIKELRERLGKLSKDPLASSTLVSEPSVVNAKESQVFEWLSPNIDRSEDDVVSREELAENLVTSIKAASDTTHAEANIPSASSGATLHDKGVA